MAFIYNEKTGEFEETLAIDKKPNNTSNILNEDIKISSARCSSTNGFVLDNTIHEKNSNGIVYTKDKHDLIYVPAPLVPDQIIIIPRVVEHITSPIFASKQIKTIKFGEKIKRIGNNVFAGCTIQEMFLYVEDPKTIAIEDEAFQEFDRGSCVLYVLYKSLEKYKENIYFRHFKEIRPIPGSELVMSLTSYISDNVSNRDGSEIDASLVSLIRHPLGILPSYEKQYLEKLEEKIKLINGKCTKKGNKCIVDAPCVYLKGIALSNAEISTYDYDNKLHVRYIFKIKKDRINPDDVSVYFQPGRADYVKNQCAFSVMTSLVEESKNLDIDTWEVGYASINFWACGSVFEDTYFRIELNVLTRFNKLVIEVWPRV